MHEEVLEEREDANLRVYAVWFSMYPTDRRENWDPEVLVDPRVVHYWDEERVVGRWYMQRLPEMREAHVPESSPQSGDVLWDAFILYGPEARWEEAPTGLRRWGRTILRTQEQLRTAVAAVLSEQAASN